MSPVAFSRHLPTTFAVGLVGFRRVVANFLQMSGSEQAKTKENVAAIMRAKQIAGMSSLSFSDRSSIVACDSVVTNLEPCTVGDADTPRSRREEKGGRRQIAA